MLAACASPAPAPTPAPAPVPDLRAVVEPTSRTQLAVGGVDTTPLTLDVEPGDVAAATTVTSTAIGEAGPGGTTWFVPAGPVTDVAVDGALARPVTLGFAAGTQHAGEVPVVWRRDPQVGWYPLVTGERGGTASAAVDRLGVHQAGWADPVSWLADRGAGYARWAQAGTSAPNCTAPPPAWATVTAPGLDVLLTCAAAGRGNRVERVEIQIRNHRATTQQIVLPPGATSDVEDQPPYLRQIVRESAGDPGAVLLPPGRRLTVAFIQPAQPVQAALVPQPTRLALAADLVAQLGGLDGVATAPPPADDAARPPTVDDSMGIALTTLGACPAAGDALRGPVPASEEGVDALLTALGTCLTAATADHTAATGLAHAFVARRAGVPAAAVASDAAARLVVENVAGRLQLLGRMAGSTDLTALAPLVRGAVGDQLDRPTGADDPAAVRVALQPRAG